MMANNLDLWVGKAQMLLSGFYTSTDSRKIRITDNVPVTVTIAEPHIQVSTIGGAKIWVKLSEFGRYDGY